MSSVSTRRVRRAQAETGKREASTRLLRRSSRQAGASGTSGGTGAEAAGRGSCSTGAAKKPRRGRAVRYPSASSWR